MTLTLDTAGANAGLAWFVPHETHRNNAFVSLFRISALSQTTSREPLLTSVERVFDPLPQSAVSTNGPKSHSASLRVETAQSTALQMRVQMLNRL